SYVKNLGITNYETTPIPSLSNFMHANWSMRSILDLISLSVPFSIQPYEGLVLCWGSDFRSNKDIIPFVKPQKTTN
ncbi:MAG: hypothetical protein UT38_C0013G0018, partial [Microgenomates group bacterium GW2011_GWA2_39_19]